MAANVIRTLLLQPRLLQLPDMVYSYCIEIKYAKRDTSDTEIEKLLADAKIQLKQYAASEWIAHDKRTTELKLSLIHISEPTRPY